MPRQATLIRTNGTDRNGPSRSSSAVTIELLIVAAIALANIPIPTATWLLRTGRALLSFVATLPRLVPLSLEIALVWIVAFSFISIRHWSSLLYGRGVGHERLSKAYAPAFVAATC